MEFYFPEATINFGFSISFNSQRDGILPIKLGITFDEEEFQFPTGWNSTLGVVIALLLCAMFQFPTGWNSTFCRHFVSFYITVSIPNGMEFYRIIDEVLLHTPGFQFPTGWNSTQSKFYRCAIPIVSIPNGMEFYARCLCHSLPALRFNSQRDGILLGSGTTAVACKERFNSQRDGILQHEFCHFSR